MRFAHVSHHTRNQASAAGASICYSEQPVILSEAKDDRLAATDDRLAAREDMPAAKGDQLAAREDIPAAKGDQPGQR